MRKFLWYLKQLFPLTYISRYGQDGNMKLCHWKMWFGRCYNISTYSVLAD